MPHYASLIASHPQERVRRLLSVLRLPLLGN